MTISNIIIIFTSANRAHCQPLGSSASLALRGVPTRLQYNFNRERNEAFRLVAQTYQQDM